MSAPEGQSKDTVSMCRGEEGGSGGGKDRDGAANK